MHLRSLPGSPIGVSSQSNAPQSRISSIRLHGKKDAELLRLAEIIAALPECEKLSTQDSYLHAVCKRWFVFTAELEFVWSEFENTFQVRAATISGFTDFGANRTRVELIRHQFDKGYLF
ncbi:MAG: DUF1499 domain-containing protein [Pseudomonadales bacterium]|nr:DUF1499 domain-containing protein [Pseudomonadales bacterium]